MVQIWSTQAICMLKIQQRGHLYHIDIKSHNLKVRGSNPLPATNDTNPGFPAEPGLLFLRGSAWANAQSPRGRHATYRSWVSALFTSLAASGQAEQSQRGPVIARVSTKAARRQWSPNQKVATRLPTMHHAPGQLRIFLDTELHDAGAPPDAN
jgi:hypothetical protein